MNNDFFLETVSATSLSGLLLGVVVVMIYFTLSEYFFKGKTLGKFLTRTRAVTIDNKRIDFKTALIRSLCRLIPLEAFSFLGEGSRGWHDIMMNGMNN